MNYIVDNEMKRLFFVASAMLLSAGLLFVSACGSKIDEDYESCTTLLNDKEGASCKLYSTDAVCCDETTCTLTHEGTEYICNKPDPKDCGDFWLNKICPATGLEERQELAKFLSAHTARLMNEVRLNSICCH